MSEKRKIMSFDWALKTVLRDKANFDILEGFLSALLKVRVEVLELLESESNQDEPVLKQNRVDVLAKLGSGERVVIEVQYNYETGYLKRVLYGAAKVIVENLAKGEAYQHVEKVISVSLIHFGFGCGSDYVYHGTTEIRGIHKQDLMVREGEDSYGAQAESEPEWEKENVFPEFYFIPIKRFNDVVLDDLDEWIYSFKNEEVLPSFKSHNIDKMNAKLNVLKMSPADKRRYENYLLHRASDEGVIEGATLKGRMDGLRQGLETGLQQGREEGREEGQTRKALEIARNILPLMDDAAISAITGLPVEQIEDLRKEAYGRGEL